MEQRYFTRAEAEALLPTLRPLLEELQRLRAEARRMDEALQQVHWKARGNGHAGREGEGDELTGTQRRREAVLTQLGERVDHIRAMGVQVKDLDAGLVDFPSLRGERVVLLCWKLGEPGIGWWHDI